MGGLIYEGWERLGFCQIIADKIVDISHNRGLEYQFVSFLYLRRNKNEN